MSPFPEKVAVWWHRVPGLTARFLPALLAILLVQLTYWAVLKPTLFDFTKPDSLAVTNVQSAELTAPTPQALAAATYEPATLPWEACCDAHYRAIRFDITLDQVPADGLGMVSGPMADNFITLVNGHLVQGEGRMMAPDATYHGNIRRVYRLPEAALHAGVNRIDVIMVRNIIPWFDFGQPYIDKRPYGEMMRATAKRSFVLNEYLDIGGTMTALVAFAAVVLALRARDRTLILWLAAMAGLYSLKILYYAMADPLLSPVWRINYYFAVANLAPAAMFCFIDVWTGHGLRWLRRAVMGITFGTLVVIAAAYLHNPVTAYDFAGDLTDWMGFATGAATVTRFAWHLVRHREARVMQLALLLLCMTTLVTDRLSEWLWDRVGGDFERIVPFLIAGLALTFLSQNLQLFRSAEEFNALLTAQLQRKEAEIAAAYQRQADLLRTAALHEERQRIMRDMHDGIGGQLVSLLMVARQATVPQAELTVALSGMVDELRLMIDSMDSVGETLPVALSIFRERIEGRLDQAGIHLNWLDESEASGPAYGPQILLQIFRIMQEAVTNVFKHAGGGTLNIRIRSQSDSAHPVRIDIVDDGRGMTPGTGDGGGGHGLGNMQTRAQSIGARLDIATGPSGTGIHLFLPAAV